MEDANLQIVFLGYFWRTWSLLDNGIYAVLGVSTSAANRRKTSEIPSV
jgi:hypothetical protein